MIELVDSHCHIDRVDLTPFDDDPAALIEDARRCGVARLLCVNIDLEHFAEVVGLAHRFAAVSASVGVHPGSTDGEDPSVETLLRLAQDPQVVAIGETGLDYHYHQGELGWQQDRFRRHIAAARESAKPLIIHTRDAKADTLAIMAAERAGEAGGVMHCFTEDWEMAQAALDLGFYISISGIVTFRNAEQVRQVAARVPLDRLLVETDAPYLTPVPHRGKPNRPGYVRHVAEFIAELRELPLAELAAATTANYHRLFPLAPALAA